MSRNLTGKYWNYFLSGRLLFNKEQKLWFQPFTLSHFLSARFLYNDLVLKDSRVHGNFVLNL